MIKRGFSLLQDIFTHALVLVCSSEVPVIEHVFKDLCWWNCLIVTHTYIKCVCVVSQICSNCSDRPIRMHTKSLHNVLFGSFIHSSTSNPTAGIDFCRRTSKTVPGPVLICYFNRRYWTFPKSPSTQMREKLPWRRPVLPLFKDFKMLENMNFPDSSENCYEDFQTRFWHNIIIMHDNIFLNTLLHMNVQSCILMFYRITEL